MDKHNIKSKINQEITGGKNTLMERSKQTSEKTIIIIIIIIIIINSITCKFQTKRNADNASLRQHRITSLI
jgi:hypothetical protein